MFTTSSQIGNHIERCLRGFSDMQFGKHKWKTWDVTPNSRYQLILTQTLWVHINNTNWYWPKPCEWISTIPTDTDPNLVSGYQQYQLILTQTLWVDINNTNWYWPKPCEWILTIPTDTDPNLVSGYQQYQLILTQTLWVDINNTNWYWPKPCEWISTILGYWPPGQGNVC